MHEGFLVTMEVGGDQHDFAFVAADILPDAIAHMVWSKQLNDPQKEFVVRVKWTLSTREPDTEVKG
jgi:hypothetical protein